MQLHPPTGCKVCLAGYEYCTLYCAIYTYINKNSCARVHVRALVRDQVRAVAASQAFGLWLDPFCPRSTSKKDILVCIYPVWIIIYHIEVSSQVPSPNHMTTMFGNNSLATMVSKEVLNPLTKDEGRDMYLHM